MSSFWCWKLMDVHFNFEFEIFWHDWLSFEITVQLCFWIIYIVDMLIQYQISSTLFLQISLSISSSRIHLNRNCMETSSGYFITLLVLEQASFQIMYVEICYLTRCFFIKHIDMICRLGLSFLYYATKSGW